MHHELIYYILEYSLCAVIFPDQLAEDDTTPRR